MTSPQETTGTLADGSTYRATAYLVEVTAADGSVLATFDTQTITGVAREGNAVTLSRGGERPVILTGATLDDAGRLELALRSAGVAGGEQQIKVYRSNDDFRSDAQRMAADGWEIVNQATAQPRAGCWRIGCLGFLALIWKPKPEITVTYGKR